ncbi:hypothetical protein [Myxococcus fulvus]|uniref:hypothetical protein n=1 Tax=Myxococcus fulvus TaxID=33 RepID=UPI0020C18208|nr:hypothetical protein [Myxococcus fulvus]MCK8496343.1 hypothetical protein [Myxococcus fulvus]
MSPPVRLTSLTARRSALREPQRAPVHQAPPRVRPLAPGDGSTFERPASAKAPHDDASAVTAAPERGGLSRVFSLVQGVVGRIFRMARPGGDPSAPDDSPTSSAPSVHGDPTGTTHA